ncbi:MAG: hypothetical protein KC593_05570 [Myxococcales bacterium]|nr:hypothetical protein [Myxococcales bacterium]MCB9629050.1 hypothetical protein [Sandaracinaceae bacterium]
MAVPAPAQRSMEEVGAAIEGAIAAAAAVPTNGEDLCGVSYRGLQAMLTSLAQAMPDQPTNPLPQRDRFLEVCREMPREVQQCLVVSYAMEHQEQCQAASENLDPAVRARLDAMMNSGAPTAPAAPAAP